MKQEGWDACDVHMRCLECSSQGRKRSDNLENVSVGPVRENIKLTSEELFLRASVDQNGSG